MSIIVTLVSSVCMIVMFRYDILPEVYEFVQGEISHIICDPRFFYPSQGVVCFIALMFVLPLFSLIRVQIVNFYEGRTTHERFSRQMYSGAGKNPQGNIFNVNPAQLGLPASNNTNSNSQNENLPIEQSSITAYDKWIAL